MLPYLWLDLETRSSLDLSEVGSGAYIEDCAPLLCIYAIGDAPVQCWDILNEDRPVALSTPVLATHYSAVVAHNGNLFDRPICNKYLGFPKLPWLDSMVKARAHNYPGELEALCVFLGIRDGKKARHDLLTLFCMPNKEGEFSAPEDYPRQWGEFLAYGATDVESMRKAWYLMPGYNYPDSKEQVQLVEADMQINDYGYMVDLPFAESAVGYLEKAAGDAEVEISRMTEGRVTKLTQTQRIKKELDALGAPTKSLAVTASRAHLAGKAAEIVSLRDDVTKTSTAKYSRILTGHSSGVMRNTFAIFVAKTGRWGGRGFQSMNLPRYSTTPLEQDLVCEAFATHNDDMIHALVAKNVHQTLSSHLRSAVMARLGHVLSVHDYANIESRVLAALAGEDWKLETFRRFDNGEGPDVYIETFERVMGVQATRPEDRNLGKVLDLSCQFGGAVGALNRSCDQANRPRFQEHESVERVKLWRSKHPRIVSFWYDCEKAMRAVILGVPSIKVRHVTFVKMGEDTVVKLPSGRCMVYPRASVSENGEIEYAFRRGILTTYAGSIVENITQAAAFDILAHAICTLTAKGYKIPLHLHDEVAAEVPVESAEPDHENIATILRDDLSPWVTDLRIPITTKGYMATRYRKD